jgi:hypothetical protein
MPGESKTITARYPSWIKLKSGAKLEVCGWNIEPVTIDLSSPHNQAAKRTVATAKVGR